MKLVHLDTGASWRGGQAQVMYLLEGLRERGHESVLIASPGALLERARSRGFSAEAWRPLGEWDAGAAWWLAGRLRRHAPDVVHAHSAHAHALGVPAARMAGVPVVVVSRRVDFEVGGNPFSRIKYRMPVDAYLCISQGVRQVLRRAGIPDSRLALVPSGVALPEPNGKPKADLRALIGVSADTPIVGTVAALAPHKSHIDLLEAADRVVRAGSPAHFAWVGEGECRAALERRRQELGLESRVHLLGFREDARALLAQFTLFALPSRLEGLCTSLLDAQALGIPIVATATGGIPDVVTDGVTGRLVPPADPEALAKALLEALARPALRAAWATAARESVRAFSAANMVEGTLAAYAAAMRTRAGARA
jgi:glycosyltransferase involved in cell wall biosynthesis